MFLVNSVGFFVNSVKHVSSPVDKITSKSNRLAPLGRLLNQEPRCDRISIGYTFLNFQNHSIGHGNAGQR